MGTPALSAPLESLRHAPAEVALLGLYGLRERGPMSTFALVSGRLHGEPATRPTRNGGVVTFLKLKVINGSTLEWWDIAIFSETARQELEGLSEGDAVSAAGALHVELFEYRGEQRIKRNVTADRVLALKPKPKPKTDKPARAAQSLQDRGGPRL